MARILTLPRGTKSPPHVLSKTGAHTLTSKSPFHANLRKTGKYSEEPTDDMEFGTLVHELLLGKGNGFEVAEYVPTPTADEELANAAERFAADPDMPLVAADNAPKKGRKKRVYAPDPPPNGPDGQPEWQDWKRKDAQAARDAIRARGLLPVLPKTLRAAETGTERIRSFLCAEFDIVLSGTSEVHIEWSEFAENGDEVLCWGAVDHMMILGDRIIAYDLKIVHSAHTKSCAAHLAAYGGDIQGIAYTRAIEALYPDMAGRVSFAFLFCEAHTGVVTPVRLSGAFEQLGSMKWKRAVDTWAECRRTDRWPAYVTETVTLDPPSYAITDEMFAQLRSE